MIALMGVAGACVTIDEDDQHEEIASSLRITISMPDTLTSYANIFLENYTPHSSINIRGAYSGPNNTTNVDFNINNLEQRAQENRFNQYIDYTELKSGIKANILLGAVALRAILGLPDIIVPSSLPDMSRLEIEEYYSFIAAEYAPHINVRQLLSQITVSAQLLSNILTVDSPQNNANRWFDSHSLEELTIGKARLRIIGEYQQFGDDGEPLG